MIYPQVMPKFIVFLGKKNRLRGLKDQLGVSRYKLGVLGTAFGFFWVCFLSFRVLLDFLGCFFVFQVLGSQG